MLKIIKYNDPKFNISLKNIIQSKRLEPQEIKLSVTKILNDIKRERIKHFLSMLKSLIMFQILKKN